MERQFELKGPAGIITAIVILGGLLIWKGPAGVMNLITTGKVQPGISLSTLDTKGREEFQAAIQQDYRRRFVEPLMRTIGDDPAAHPDEAAQLVAVVKTVDSLAITKLTANRRGRMDTGDRLELHVDVEYTMQPAPPDGVTSRRYSADVYKHGRGRWEIHPAD